MHYTSGLKLNFWMATALQRLAPTHSCLDVSSNPEELDYLVQVCLIRVGAKLRRAVALHELSLRPVHYINMLAHFLLLYYKFCEPVNKYYVL